VAPTSPPPCSSGSKAGTTPAAATPPSATSARSSTKPFTPPPTSRHDQHTVRVRRTGSGSAGDRPVRLWGRRVRWSQGHPSGEVEDGSGDPGGLVGDEECDRLGDVRGL